ncbi:MAG: DUF3369 domain-containing protein [Pseudomonadota bacterium]
MIVDDEPEVHHVTQLVLADYTFGDAGLTFLNAYSGGEALDLIKKHPDTAVALMDVVMETDQAGLEAVRQIRDDIGNGMVRIILRTGQPGQAPEKKVILEYDINDYKAKSELTSQKLFTAVTSALRSYRDLKIIDRSRKGLEMIIDSAGELLKPQSLAQFTSGVLMQMTSLLGLNDDSLLMQTAGFAVSNHNGAFRILAATGQFEQYVDRRADEVLDEEIRNDLGRAVAEGKSFVERDRFVGYFRTSRHSENVLYLKCRQKINHVDTRLVQVFLGNVAVSFDNLNHRVNLEKLVEERTRELNLEKEKLARAQSILCKYVPSQLTERICEGKVEEVWKTARGRLTMFFSDIKDFTRLTEIMEPEDSAGLLNEYFSEMYKIASRYGGVVANVKGDELFIFFGVNDAIPDKEHAVKCVNMALEMQRRMSELAVKWFEDGLEEPLRIRCGVNTGIVNVGGFGSPERKNYTAMGMHVNLASRLETACEPGKILISHSTWALVKDKFECRPLGKMEVKGFSHPVLVYDVSGVFAT